MRCAPKGHREQHSKEKVDQGIDDGENQHHKKRHIRSKLRPIVPPHKNRHDHHDIIKILSPCPSKSP